MKKILTLVTLLCLSLVLAGCNDDLDSDQYDSANIGEAQTVRYGVIAQVLPVTVQNQGSSTIGMLGGAALGAVLGSTIGGGNTANAVGGIAGGLVGGTAGNAVGKSVGKQTGTQYIVKVDDGSTLSVVQGITPALTVGQRVMILTGSDARDRVIADNTSSPSASTSSSTPASSSSSSSTTANS